MVRYFVLLLLLGLSTALRAEPTLTFAGSDSIGTLIDRQNAMFTKLVNQRASGRLKVNFIQGEQLGNDIQVIEQTMQGATQIYGDVLDWYANWVKDFAVLSWGFTFRDNLHAEKFLASAAFQRMSDELRSRHGLRILAAALFAKRAVARPIDLLGLKMRVPEIKTYLKVWETLGTKPSRVAWAEVFLGLKTGVIEAAEGPVSSSYAAKLHQAAPYIMRTDHVVTLQHITINERAYQKLPAEVQKIVTDAAREALAWSRSQAQQETDATLRKMGSEGARVQTVDRKPFADVLVGAVKAMEGEGIWAKGLWQHIQTIR